GELAGGGAAHRHRVPERLHRAPAGDHEHLARLRRVLPGALLLRPPGPAGRPAGRRSVAAAPLGAADGAGPDRDLPARPDPGTRPVGLDRDRRGGGAWGRSSSPPSTPTSGPPTTT